VLDDKTQRKSGQIGALLHDALFELGQTNQLAGILHGLTENLR
jgi:hypothetical protein